VGFGSLLQLFEVARMDAADIRKKQRKQIRAAAKKGEMACSDRKALANSKMPLA
jgi:hypothetical protein